MNSKFKFLCPENNFARVKAYFNFQNFFKLLSIYFLRIKNVKMNAKLKKDHKK